MTSEVKGVLSVTESKEAGFVACSDLAASQHGDLHQALMKTRQDKTRQDKSSQGIYLRNPKWEHIKQQ